MLPALPGSSRRLQTHLVLVFVGLFALIQAVAFIAMDQGRTRVALGHVSQELDAGEHIFGRLLTQDREQLERSALLLATDFGFRAAIATNDVNTIVSALRNHGDRIDANVMQLISLDGRILADTKGHRAAGEPFRFRRLLDLAESAGKATATVVMSDRLGYQLVVVPVRAPDVVAWVAMGFLLDDMLCLIKMITANVFDRWWGVKFVFCQLGGFLPFTMGRFDQQYFFERRVYEQEKRPMPEYLQRRVVEYCQAFYVDTHTADASAMRCALDCMSADRIVLGGDYPISPPEIGLGYTIPQLDKVGLSAGDRTKIERGNASKLLNLP